MQLSVGSNRRYGVQVRGKAAERANFLDVVQVWLESEDYVWEWVVGYGLCLVTFLFLLFQILRSLLL
ncbi:MAG: hypothetical protein FH756_14185 [Firmicutes bacterium]|nr:hypothetical protein [Bacillota bacterium]